VRADQPTCGADTLATTCSTGRGNIEGLSSYFSDSYTLIVSNSTLSVTDQLTQCNGNWDCWLQIGLSALLSQAFLAVCLLVVSLIAFFTRARATRLTNQLHATNKALEEEHHDKIRLIRSLDIDLD